MLHDGLSVGDLQEITSYLLTAKLCMIANPSDEPDLSMTSHHV